MDYVEPLQLESFSQSSSIFLAGGGILVLIVIIIFIVGLWRKIRQNEELKTEFITIVAHKFRTPLTQTRWLTETLLSDEKDPYKKESILEIQKANQGLINLTNTLIELTDSDSSSVASYMFEKIALCSMVRSVGESMKDLFKEKNLFFSVKCPENEVYVKGDRARLEFVIQTIFDNAIVYSPTGKNVEISVEGSGRTSTVSVRDHGIGIDPSDLERIFTKFFRSEEAQRIDTEGFGICLYLARAITRRHHGKIEVFSEGRGYGSTFKVILPKV